MEGRVLTIVPFLISTSTPKNDLVKVTRHVHKFNKENFGMWKFLLSVVMS